MAEENQSPLSDNDSLWIDDSISITPEQTETPVAENSPLPTRPYNRPFSNRPPRTHDYNDEHENFGNRFDRQETISISKRKLVLIYKLLDNIRENTQHVHTLLGSRYLNDNELAAIGQTAAVENAHGDFAENPEKTVEGVFNGQHMIGPDGHQYTIPANYASKSKLVEGDILKLSIMPNGRFIYKQVGPIERSRLVGKLVQANENDFRVQAADGRSWRILTASVTYFRGQVGDEVIILVPKQGESLWAAAENIVNRMNPTQ